jgi:hypothetical protein
MVKAEVVAVDRNDRVFDRVVNGFILAKNG